MMVSMVILSKKDIGEQFINDDVVERLYWLKYVCRFSRIYRSINIFGLIKIKKRVSTITKSKICMFFDLYGSQFAFNNGVINTLR